MSNARDSVILSGIRAGAIPTKLTRDVFSELVGFLQDVAKNDYPAVERAQAREFLGLICKVYRSVEETSHSARSGAVPRRVARSQLRANSSGEKRETD